MEWSFKRLLELIWTLVHVFHRSMKQFHAVASFAKQVDKIKLLQELLVNKLLRVSFATTIAGFLRSTASWFFLDDWQTCLRVGKTLKVVLCTEFCPLCDKQVIASALGQLRINFTCIFKVFQNVLVASWLGQFCENFENTREINP